jgi:hypothetical protein
MANEFDVSGFASALGETPKNTQSSVTVQSAGNVKPVRTSNVFTEDEIDRLIKTESSKNPYAINKETKAMGYGQFTPDTLAMLHKKGIKFDPFDEKEARGAIKTYLNMLTEQTGSKEGALKAYGGFVTKDPSSYVSKILNNTIPSASAQTPSGEFDVSGFKNALSNEAQPKTEEPVKTETKSTKAQKRVESENKLQAQMDEMLGNVPGYKSAQSFVMGAGKNISDTAATVQQLVGKGIGMVAPETGEAIAQNARQNALKAEEINKPFAEANSVANITGNVTGAVVNPINKIIPGAGATTLIGNVVKGAFQGAANMGLTTPVLNEEKSFAGEKLRQMAFGATAGAAGGAVIHTASGIGSWIGKNLGDTINTVRSQFGGMVTPQNANQATDAVLKTVGIDASKVAPDILAGLKEQAAQSLKTGDVSNLKRFADAMSLPIPVPMLRGQVTRDPMQFAVEQNLRGIAGVGEPITDVLSAQNKALIANLDKIGAEGARDVVSSGHSLSTALKQADEVERKAVGDAYKAFKQSTGKDLEVPLTGLAQDYTKINKDFGDLIPNPIKAKFEALGLVTGKPTKTFSIEDAEQLIKDINLRYDPLNKPQATAFGQLNNAIEKAIKSSGEGLQGEAAKLAKTAREAASNRFDTINNIPALKDVTRGIEPDKFVQKHILQGNINEISSLSKYLKKNNPEELAQLQSDVMGVIKAKVLNNVSAENATFSQAQLKTFLSNENAPKLARILTPEQMGALRQLNRTAENALYKPATSAVNTSNTAAAQANINNAIKGGTINELLGITQGIPGLSSASEYLARKNQSRLASDLIQKATNPSAPISDIAPKSLVARPGVVGSTSLRELINIRNREQQ